MIISTISIFVVGVTLPWCSMSSERTALRQKAVKVLEEQRKLAEDASNNNISPKEWGKDEEFIRSKNSLLSSSSSEYSTIAEDGVEAQQDRENRLIDPGDGDGRPVTPDVLLYYEDFWVRTKAPLNYSMILVHQLQGINTGGTDDDGGVKVKASGKPMQCYKTKVLLLIGYVFNYFD